MHFSSRAQAHLRGQAPISPAGDKRGQGTIEYLVILAVIVVIGLVVVSLLSSLMNTNSTVKSMNKLNSKIGYGGISIMESVADPNGDAAISMKNISGENLIITRITVCGVSGDYGLNGETLVSGSTVNFTLNGTNLICTVMGSNNQKECDVIINAKSIYAVDKTISGVAYLDCVPDVLVNGTVFSAQAKRPIITMFSPTQPTYSTSSNVVDFNFSVADENSAISSCVLKIDSVDKNTITSPTLNQLYSRQNSLAVGAHDWNLRCIDANNNFVSTAGTITITAPVAPALFAGGDGSYANPYQITDCNQLSNIRLFLDSNFILSNDIDCSVSRTWYDGNGFPVMGSYQVGFQFKGTFNGNYKKISQLYMYRSIQPDSYEAMFAYVGTGAVLKNFSLTDFNVSFVTQGAPLVGTNKGLIQGVSTDGNVNILDNSYSSYYSGFAIDNYGGQILDSNVTVKFQNSIIQPVSTTLAAGLVSMNQSGSTISNCIVTLDMNMRKLAFQNGIISGVNGGTISNSKAYGKIISDYTSMTGGITGSNSGGTIDNCYASVDLNGSQQLGGIAGRNDSSGVIKNSYSTGKINAGYDSGVGGLVGFMYNGRVINSYSDVNVKAFAAYSQISDSGVGGLVGLMRQPANTPLTTEIIDSYSFGDVNGVTYTGGLVGLIGVSGSTTYNGAIRNSYSSSRVLAGATKGGLVGYITPVVGFPQSQVSSSYWDLATSGIATCIGGGSCAAPDCNCASVASRNSFYNVSHAVYTSTPSAWTFGANGTDNNWSNVCNTVGLPSLLWQGITLTSQCKQ